MQIGNFTPDNVRWEHQGIGGVIKSDTVVEFPRGRGNFILNSVGKRGLVKMEYVEPEGSAGYTEHKKAESLAQYKRFWEYQIHNMNYHNEQLKNERKPYVRPTEELQEKAKELNIKLLGPWQIDAPVSDAQVEVLKSKNAEKDRQINDLQSQVSELSSQVSQLLTAFNQGKVNPANTEAEADNEHDEETEPAIDIEAKKKKFLYMSANQLPDFIDKNKKEIETWPAELLNALDEKHIKLFNSHLEL